MHALHAACPRVDHSTYVCNILFTVIEPLTYLHPDHEFTSYMMWQALGLFALFSAQEELEWHSSAPSEPSGPGSSRSTSHEYISPCGEAGSALLFFKCKDIFDISDL